MDIIKHFRIPQNLYIICVKDTRMDIKKTQISYLFNETDNVYIIFMLIDAKHID